MSLLQSAQKDDEARAQRPRSCGGAEPPCEPLCEHEIEVQYTLGPLQKPRADQPPHQARQSHGRHAAPQRVAPILQGVQRIRHRRSIRRAPHHNHRAQRQRQILRHRGNLLCTGCANHRISLITRSPHRITWQCGCCRPLRLLRNLSFPRRAAPHHWRTACRVVSAALPVLMR